MSLYLTSATVGTLFMLALTLLVLHNSRDRKSILFGLSNFAIIIWNISDLFIALISNHTVILWLYRFSNAGALLLPPLFVRFVFCLTGTEKAELRQDVKWKHRLLKILDVAALTVMPICLTPLVFKDLQLNPLSEIRGPAFIIFALTFVFGLILGLIDLFQGVKHSKGQERKQLLYFILALLVGFSGICIYLSQNLALGPIYFSLEALYAIIIAYTVIQHKFLDIHVIANHALVVVPCVLLLLMFVLPSNLRVSSSLASAALCFSLAYFVLRAKNKTDANKYFALFNVSLGIWNIGELLVLFPKNTFSLLFYRLTYMGGSFIVPSFLNFMYVLFGYKSNPKVHKYIKTYSVLSYIFAALAFTPFLIRDVSYVRGGPSAIIEIPGPGFFFFAIFFLTGLIYSLKPLYSTYKVARGVKKNQLRFVIIAVGIGMTAVLVYFLSFVFPKMPPIYYLIQMGVMAAFAVAILRYKLVDSNIFFKKVLVYFAASLVCAMPFVLAALSTLFQGRIIQLLIAALLLYPYLFWIVHAKFDMIADTLLFPRFAYYDRLYAIEKTLDTALTSGQVAETLVKSIVNQMKLIGGAMMIYDKFQDAFVARAKVGLPEIMTRQMPNALDLHEGNPLISHFQKFKSPVILEELSEKNDEEILGIKDAMADIEAFVCIPLYVKGSLRGILGLGYKESHDMFNQEDMAALEYLAREAEKKLTNIFFMEERVLFSSGLAHDMRAPMMKAGRMWEVLNKLRESGLGALNEAQQKAFDVVYRDAVLLKRLISTFSEVGGQLVQFLSTGRMTGEFDCKEILEYNVALCKPEAEAKNLELKVLCPDSLPLVYGNEQEISRVLNNLLENALKFTERGSVSVEARILPKHVQLRITDTGPGISDKDKEAILQPGGQAETSQKKQGLGLGLAIVKDLVEANGGEFGFESQWGSGSTFYFTIPVAVPKMQAEAA